MRDDKEIRRKILELLYKAKRKDIYNIVPRDDLLQKLNIPENLLDFNISYLEDTGYIITKRYEGMSPNFDVATIANLGIDFVEGEGLGISMVPGKVNVTVVKGDVKGTISQGDEARIKTEIREKKTKEESQIDLQIAEIKRALFDNVTPVSRVALECLELARRLDMKDDKVA